MRSDLRKNARKSAVRSEKPSICAYVLSLWARDPPHTFLVALLLRGVEDSKGDCRQIRRRRVCTWTLQLARRYFYVYGSHFVWPRVRRKRRRGIDAIEPGHVDGCERLRLANDLREGAEKGSIGS
jgi:hypothetical protein